MNIGIDIDDTMTDTTKLANAILHNEYPNLNIKDYHELKKEDFIKFCELHLPEIQKYMVLKDGVVETLKFWKKKGYKIYIITARGSKGMNFLIPITLKFLKNNNIPYDEIIFKQERKGNACKNKNIDIFIDDKEKVLDEVKKKNPNIRTIRFLNKKEVSKHESVRSWFEINI